MKRHRFDPFSFVFGVTFLVLAGGLSFERLHFDAPALRWVGAGLLLLLGIVLLLTSTMGSDKS